MPKETLMYRNDTHTATHTRVSTLKVTPLLRGTGAPRVDIHFGVPVGFSHIQQKGRQRGTEWLGTYTAGGRTLSAAPFALLALSLFMHGLRRRLLLRTLR